MEAPTTVGALMELVYGAIPRFSELIEPLRNLHEAQYSLCNSRRKSRVCNRPLSAWGDEHQAAFTSLVQAITPVSIYTEHWKTLVPLRRRIIYTLVWYADASRSS